MTSISALPSAALQVILGHLCNPGPEGSAEHCSAARLTCRRWADVSCAAISSITPKKAAGLVDAAHKFKALTTVDLRYIRSIDASAAYCFSQLRCLRRLSLVDSTCWDAVRGTILQVLSTACPALTHLEISAVTDALAVQLGQLPQLRCLSLSGRLTNHGLQQLSALSQLQQLSLSCCDAITDSGLEVLTALQQLSGLQLHSCLQLGDAALAVVGQLTQLTALSASHSFEDSTSAGLLCLNTLRNLRHLNLSAASEGASPHALAQLLSVLPQLTYLDVSYCEHVNPIVLRAIAGLQHLEVLGLSGINPGTLHSLRCLRQLSKLQQLQMRWIGQLKDTHASFLPHLVALTALDLSYCRSLAGEGLQQLQWLTQLRALNLMAVGSEDLGFLHAMQQLTGLTVLQLPQSCQAWQDIASLTLLQTLALRRCTFGTGRSKRSIAGTTCSSSSASTSSDDGFRVQKQVQPAVEAAASAAAAGPAIGVSCLASLQQLTALDCSGSSLEVAALTVLQQLAVLHHLGLARCQNVTNAVLAALGGCSALHKLDLRLRGSGCSWTLRGLLGLLQQQPGLAVYVTEVPSGLPAKEECRVLACSTEQVPLPVARDAGYRLGPVPLF